MEGAKIDGNTWIMLCSAAVLAAAGLATNSSVSIVASMLVSVSMRYQQQSHEQ